MSRSSDWRMFLALSAGAVGVLICLHQQHFTLHWSAASFIAMIHHRCGMVMVAATFWVVAEVATQAARSYRAASSRLLST